MLCETVEPCISVSSMTSHPKNPFTIVSAHLDNSVIVWDLMGINDIFLSQMNFILDLGIVESCCDPHDLMVPTLNDGRLSGEMGKHLITQLKKVKRPAEKFIEIIKFFNQQDGDVELCNMINVMGDLGLHDT